MKNVGIKHVIRIKAGKLALLMMPPKLGNRVLRKMNRNIKFPEGIKRLHREIGGVTCDVFTGTAGAEDKVLLYIHGGGFVFGQAPMYLKYCALLSKRLHVRVIAIDYALAPYPAGLKDCFAVYKQVLAEGVKPKNIAVAGDSAGGCYTLTLLLKIKEQALPLPSAAVCFSPAVSCSADGFDRNIADPMLPWRGCVKFAAFYCGAADPKIPFVSPLYGDFTGMPPIRMYAGEREILLTSMQAFAKRGQTEGWDISLQVVPHMFHIFPIYTGISESRQVTDEVVAFLKARLYKT